MAARWRDPAAFRADPDATPALRPNRRQTVALLTALVLVAGSIVAASYLVRPERARAFELLHGSLFLADIRGPVAIDLASAKPTVRIGDSNTAVHASTAVDLAVAPLDAGTLLLNTATGEFNLIDSTGFVVKHNGGVPLPKRAGDISAVAIPAGDNAYIEQTGPGGTSVYLVTPTTVVNAADRPAKPTKARASRSMAEQGSTTPGSAASTDNSLWLLVGSGAQRTVRQLSFSVDSSPGASLRSVDHGVVDRVAALGSARPNPTARTIGVATAGAITLYPGAKTHTFAAPQGVRSILPATDQDSRLSYLLHSAAGWSVVSVGADGSALRAPALLHGIPADANLLEPAQSDGSLYTMDRATGVIYRITGTTATKAADYPLAEQNGTVIERGGYTDAYLIARQSRVIVNSPGHRQALALFTDGSHTPLRIEKGAGVPVSAAGGAVALAQDHTARTTKPGKTKPVKPPPGTKPPVRQPKGTNQVDCKNTAQTPHIPLITAAQPGSRTVALHWSYPLLDREDCEPTSYVVGVKLISNGAPQPTGTVPVENAKDVNITGLYPSTQYDLTVTAYINGRGTTSAATRVTTGKEGPAAPTGVTVTADASGNWNLSWSSCGGVAQSCVPAASWNVIPHFCDGAQGGGALPSTTVLADPTSRQQPPSQYKGSDALLGRGLSFEIEGTGQDQTTGAPSAATRCVHSWRPPNAAALHLAASTPPDTVVGGSTTTTVTLDLGNAATRDVGGLGASVDLSLTGPDGVRTKHAVYAGQTQITATFDGIVPAVVYRATATITPPSPAGHAVSLPAVVVTPAQATWPALTVSAQCPRIGFGLSCDLSVSISGVSSATAHGEKFDLTGDSRLTCGASTLTLSQSDFDPATTTITVNGVSQLDELIGSCTVRVGLIEDPSTPAPEIFGGVASAPATTQVDLGAPARADIRQGDLSVSWDGSGGASTVDIAYDPALDNRISTLTTNWTHEIDAPDGTPCGGTTGSARPTSFAVTPACVDLYGGEAGNWTVTVGYTDKSDGTRQGPFTYKLAGPPPSYQPCTPASFSASWGALIADGVTVSYGATDSAGLAGCSNWQYSLADPTDQACGTPDGKPTPPDAVVIKLACETPPSIGWTVTVTYDDTAGQKHSVPVLVAGDPPTS